MLYIPTAVIPAQFGESFRRERAQRKLTQAGLAEKAGVTRQTILQIEKGENVGLHAIMRALAALNMGLRIDTAQINYDDVEGLFDE
ncbi:helix-turn-helix transcriptional regulator [Burkholderia perseverans]|uniref:helix-turn-helix transcriptional regulator n=1 Tax=Burkholderia perseverans TaxID=2615214 RepID=UPI001FEE006C|nr:helix-turn-helix transcriptional regulator [Burkholderia perseverans]